MPGGETHPCRGLIRAGLAKLGLEGEVVLPSLLQVRAQRDDLLCGAVSVEWGTRRARRMRTLLLRGVLLVAADDGDEVALLLLDVGDPVPERVQLRARGRVRVGDGRELRLERALGRGCVRHMG
jgi:hypothetical protein